jgi:hypothetical protein
MTRSELVEKMARDMREAWRDREDMRSETVEWGDICGAEYLDCLAQAAAALAAIEAAGCVVVPREVTNPMLDAAMRAWTPGMNHAGAHEERYRAMIAASPLAKDAVP